MSSLPIQARLVLTSGTVITTTGDIALPARRGVGSIGKRGRARIRSTILRQFADSIGLAAKDFTAGTIKVLDAHRAYSMGYGQFVGQGDPVHLVRRPMASA